MENKIRTIKDFLNIDLKSESGELSPRIAKNAFSYFLRACNEFGLNSKFIYKFANFLIAERKIISFEFASDDYIGFFQNLVYIYDGEKSGIEWLDCFSNKDFLNEFFEIAEQDILNYIEKLNDSIGGNTIFETIGKLQVKEFYSFQKACLVIIAEDIARILDQDIE